MIRFCLGLIIIMGAADAPPDAPLDRVIIQVIIGLLFAAFGARKLAKQEN